MNKVYRVRKLSKAQADSIEEITFGNKETAAGQVAVKYLNEETMATLQVGYDTLRGMLCAGAEIPMNTSPDDYEGAVEFKEKQDKKSA